jgi:hypothetical protein
VEGDLGRGRARAYLNPRDAAVLHDKALRVAVSEQAVEHAGALNVVRPQAHVAQAAAGRDRPRAPHHRHVRDAGLVERWPVARPAEPLVERGRVALRMAIQQRAGPGVGVRDGGGGERAANAAAAGGRADAEALNLAGGRVRRADAAGGERGAGGAVRGEVVDGAGAGRGRRGVVGVELDSGRDAQLVDEDGAAQRVAGGEVCGCGDARDGDGHGERREGGLRGPAGAGTGRGGRGHWRRPPSLGAAALFPVAGGGSGRRPGGRETSRKE